MAGIMTQTGGVRCGSMLALSAFDADFGLLVTFLGLGVVVNGLVVYIVAQALGERAENRRHLSGDESEQL
jgi:hypothetical protein